MEKSSGIGNTDVGLVVWADLVLFVYFVTSSARERAERAYVTDRAKGFMGFASFSLRIHLSQSLPGWSERWLRPFSC